MLHLPSAEEPQVSLIVLLDGAAEMGERCLRALAESDDAIPSETILVLNDPSPELERLVRHSTSGARVLVSRANAGAGVGWNLGAEVARAPRLATLHEDSEPEPSWLAPLCDAMTEHRAGAVGARLYNRDGSVQNCGWVLFSDAGVQQLNAATAPDVVASAEPTPADLVSGAAMLVDREAVTAVGGWDERFHPAVFADVDVSTALWAAGWPVLSVPASGVRHDSGALGRREGSPLTGPRLSSMLFERNRERFVAKWGQVLGGLAPSPSSIDPEEIRAAVAPGISLACERHDEIGAGGRSPRADTRAERPFTGLPDPVRDGVDGAFQVAPQVEAALDAAEAELIGEYCLWLVRREEGLQSRLLEVSAELGERNEEAAGLHRRLDQQQRASHEAARALDMVLRSRAWRLRTAAGRALRRLRRRPTTRAGG